MNDGEGDYAVRRRNSERASAVSPTQAEAIERARQLNPAKPPLVEPVRFTQDGKPDKCRKLWFPPFSAGGPQPVRGLDGEPESGRGNIRPRHP